MFDHIKRSTYFSTFPSSLLNAYEMTGLILSTLLKKSLHIKILQLAFLIHRLAMMKQTWSWREATFVVSGAWREAARP